MVTVLNLAQHKQSIMDFQKKRATFAQKEQDPMSHRIIEKRRRDRMNNCLADLSRLIPTDYLKKGRGRIEKTEIIEMAIKHLKYLQDKVNSIEHREIGLIPAEPFRLGYQECVSEVMRYLVKREGHYPRDPVNLQLINHLHRHCDNVLKSDTLNKLRSNPDSNSSSSSTSSNYMIYNQTNVPKNVQRIMTRTAENSGRLHQHTNSFEEKPLNIDYNRNNQDYDEELIDDAANKSQSDGENRNMNTIAQGNNANFSGLKTAEGNVDEGGGLRTDFLPKSSPIIIEDDNNDSHLVQDLRLANSYSPIPSSYHYVYCEQTRRNIKDDNNQQGDSGLSISSTQVDPDYIHSYKFKNTIKQRFSQSKSTDGFSSSPSDMVHSYKSTQHPYPRQDKASHKKRKSNDHQHQIRNMNNRYNNNNQYKDQTLSSETNSSDNITSVSQNSIYHSNNTEVANLGSGRPTDNNYQLGQNGKMSVNFSKVTRIGVPIFALHAKGSFYVPLKVDYECLIPFLGPYDLLDTASLQTSTSFHPITISVNF